MDVDGISVATAEAIQGELLNTITINGAGHLVFTRNNGEIIDAGLVMRPVLDSWPVGSIHMSANPANPSTYLGGAWTPWGVGRVPVGVDASQTEFNAVEKTGGAKTHTLLATEMPVHTHTATVGNQSADHTHNGTALSAGIHDHDLEAHNDPGGTSVNTGVRFGGSPSATTRKTSPDGIHTHPLSLGVQSAPHNHVVTLANAGGGAAHNNLQPYITCYMWKRIASGAP